MHKFIKALGLTFLLSLSLAAQTPTTVDDEDNKNEFYGGYSYQRTTNLGNSRNFNGFEVAYTRNVSRYFGIKADVSGAFRGDDFSIGGFDATNGAYTYRGETRSEVYNFLGGVQIKDNASRKRFKPFAHALAGVAVNRNRFSRLTCTQGTCPSFVDQVDSFKSTDTGFAAAIGGGLDIRINDKIDFRAIQIDYNPIYSDRRFDNNVRFGIGVVFK
jgi:hypothetical protein